MEVETVIVRYDGPALAGHKMDVADLAPALLGLSELFKTANAKFNGDAATVKVFISVDEEQKCFQFGVDVVQTVMQTVQAYLDHQAVKTAGDLLKYIGIASGTAFGLIKLLKELKGKTKDEIEEKQIVKDGQTVIQFSIKGDKNRVYFVYPETAALLKDKDALESAKRVVEPVTKDGYDKLEFEEAGRVTERVTKDQARQILELPAMNEPEVDLGDPQEVTAFVQVYAPVYAKDAKNWQFEFAGGHHFVDISETDIARNAMQRGAAAVNDTYKVRLEIQQTKTASGRLSARYKIKQVLDFLPATIPVQHVLIKEPPKATLPPLTNGE